MKNPKIALIELGRSHAECLYTQLLFWTERGYDVDIVFNSFLSEEIEYFDKISSKIAIDFSVGKWTALYNLYRILFKADYKYFVFNSIQEKHARLFLSIPFLKKVPFLGTLHRINKLKSSIQLKIIAKRATGIYVLNDYLLDTVQGTGFPLKKTGSFYPIFFPNYSIEDYVKDKNDIWITIPGNVEFKRRDYKKLLDQLSGEGLGDNIKLFFLGRSAHRTADREYFQGIIKQFSMEKKVITWADRVSNQEFYGVLHKTDIILPLIHTSHDSSKMYFNQISGSFNLAFGFNKLLMLPEDILNTRDFDKNVIRYKEDDLIGVINKLRRDNLPSYEKIEKMQFENQLDKYWGLIN